ncbi:MAG TPA: Spy/CpxP family protein refolding chaperone, partial [Candidatus Paceibacterota bacterium]|nr:Spy/CpxP family protein refolding chaperone [Candidatus Paceibacterota bacterium]
QLLQRAREKLDLTDEQAAQIKAVLKEDKETLRGLLSRMHEARSGLREAIHAEGATPDSVRAASAKVAAVESDLAVERLKLFGKISPILTAEQREKLQQAGAQLDAMVENAINHLGRKSED